MDFGLWLLSGAIGSYLFGKFKRSAMGPTGDILLGLGGGVAGGALLTGFGLGGVIGAVIGGALGGVAMNALVAALKD
jgi:hypothetical protein